MTTVPHFVATYRYAAGSEAARDVARPAHRAFLDALDALVLSGPTDGPQGAGAVLVLDAGSAQAVEALLDDDPFATAGGIIEARSVAGWTIVSGRAGGRLG